MPEALAAVLEALPLAALAVDASGRVVAASAPAREHFGTNAVGRPFVTVLRHPAINAALDLVLGTAAGHTRDAGAATGSARLRLTLTLQGQEATCDVSVTPLPSAAGGAAVVVLEDLTALDRAEAMRRDFVANVSHELRTPLTSLMGFIETLRGPARDDPAARERFLKIMEAEAGRMNRLIADLLSLSRVEGEERRRPSGRVDLALLLRGVAASFAPAAAAAGVALRLDGAEGAVEVPGDTDQLVQVVSNLVENALKYGASGGEVRLSLSRIEADPRLRGPARVIEVADRGEGIEPLHLPRLTERFYRVDAHRSRAQGGTGLGLAIVKHIVGRHRGRLRIDSAPGEGSRFAVILPER